jgi:hypothetical protein
MDSLILKELKIWQQDWILNTSLYFPEGIHVKYSPRTASQSLKLLLINILFPNSDLDFLTQKRILQTISIPNYKSNLKIAIKRDPVDRFISALNFDYSHWGYGNFQNTMKCPNTMDEVFQSGWFDFMFKHNKHYFPQTFYVGESKDYDLIFDINDLSNLVEFLNQIYASDCSVSKINSSVKFFQKEMLSEQQLELVKERYNLDYDNGWY